MLFIKSSTNRYRKAKRQKLRDIKDRISAYMIGEEDSLSEADSEIMNRWLCIWGELENGKSPGQAVKSHMDKYASEGNPISRRTAYLDLNNATEMWGSLQEISQRAQTVLLRELAMKTFQTAALHKDTKEMNRAVANLKDIAKLMQPFLLEDDAPRTFVLQIHGKDGKAQNFDLNSIHSEQASVYHEIIEAMEEEEVSADEMELLLLGKSTADEEEEEDEEAGL